MSSNEEAAKESEDRFTEPADVEGHRTRPVGPTVEGEARHLSRSDDDAPDVEGHRRQF